MNKYIFLVVISVDKAITVLYVEPFYRTGDFVGNNFLLNWLFLFDLWFFSRGHVADGYSL